MVVHSHRENLLGIVLPNHIAVEVLLYLDGCRDGFVKDVGGLSRRHVGVENLVSPIDAILAYKAVQAGNKLSGLRFGCAAKGALLFATWVFTFSHCEELKKILLTFKWDRASVAVGG